MHIMTSHRHCSADYNRCLCYCLRRYLPSHLWRRQLRQHVRTAQCTSGEHVIVRMGSNESTVSFLHLAFVSSVTFRFLFPMDISDAGNSKWICVKECPNDFLHYREDIYNYALRRNTTLCEYNVPLEQYRDRVSYPSTQSGPCPILPVYKRSSH